MIPMEEIQSVCDQVVRQFHPDMVILFGSYAYGSPHEDSDIDLLVIMPFEGKNIYQSVKIGSAIQRDFPLDLIVRKPEDTQRRYQQYDPMIRMALDKGKILYERIPGSLQRMAS